MSISSTSHRPILEWGRKLICAPEEREVIEYAQEKIQEIARNEFQRLGLDLEGLPTTIAHKMAMELCRWIPEKTGQPFANIIEINMWLHSAHWLHLTHKDALYFDWKIGSGGESTVHGALSIQGTRLAVLQSSRELTNYRKQIDFLKRLQSSEFVMHLFDGNSSFLIEEYAPYELWNVMHEKGKYPQFMMKLPMITEGILRGVADIHEAGIIHGDIKLDNILLQKSGKPLIADFGYAANRDAGLVLGGGTLEYYAPEQIAALAFRAEAGEDTPLPRFSHKVDLWQTMLAIAFMNLSSLSPSYQSRFQEYLTALSKLEREAKKECEMYFEENPSEYSVENESYKYAALYSRKVHNYLESIIAQRRENGEDASGLFSDLPTESPLEKMLCHMSFFDPEARPEAKDLLSTYFLA